MSCDLCFRPAAAVSILLMPSKLIIRCLALSGVNIEQVTDQLPIRSTDLHLFIRYYSQMMSSIWSWEKYKRAQQVILYFATILAIENITSIISTTSVRVSSRVQNTEKQMKSRDHFGRVLLLFRGVWNPWWNPKHDFLIWFLKASFVVLL